MFWKCKATGASVLFLSNRYISLVAYCTRIFLMGRWSCSVRVVPSLQARYFANSHPPEVRYTVLRTRDRAARIGLDLIHRDPTATPTLKSRRKRSHTCNTSLGQVGGRTLISCSRPAVVYLELLILSAFSALRVYALCGRPYRWPLSMLVLALSSLLIVMNYVRLSFCVVGIGQTSAERTFNARPD